MEMLKIQNMVRKTFYRLFSNIYGKVREKQTLTLDWFSSKVVC